MTTAGSLALAGAHAAAGRVHRRAAARGGRGDPRQDQPERVGELPLDALDERLERPRRPDDATRTRSIATRRGSSSGSGAAIAANLARGRRRHRDRRLDRLARRATTALVGIKPTVGLVSRSRHHPDRPQPGHRRPDGAHRGRRRRAARRAGRRRSATTPATASQRAAGPARLHARSSTPNGLQGRAHRRRRATGCSATAPAADRARRGGDRRR